MISKDRPVPGVDCYPLKAAYWLARLIPRGKGYIPRLIGKLFKSRIHHAIKTRHGALLPIVPEALDVFTSMLMQDNSWDYWVFRAINQSITEGGCFFDVGANVGY